MCDSTARHHPVHSTWLDINIGAKAVAVAHHAIIKVSYRA